MITAESHDHHLLGDGDRGAELSIGSDGSSAGKVM